MAEMKLSMMTSPSKMDDADDSSSSTGWETVRDGEEEAMDYDETEVDLSSLKTIYDT